MLTAKRVEDLDEKEEIKENKVSDWKPYTLDENDKKIMWQSKIQSHFN